jgi:hypothetical protein
MKRTALLFAALLVALPPVLAQPSETEGWKLRKNRNGIQVFVRSVPGSGFKEFMATAELDAGITSVIRLMEDTDSYPQWFPQIKESKVLKMISSRELILYQMMDIPFPLKDRDCILRVQVSRDRKTGAVTFQLSSLWEYLPEKAGVIRVKSISGRWTFVPDAARGVVLVTYRMHSEPEGTLPAWLANTAVVKRPFTVLTNMRKMLTKPAYRDAKESELRLFK